MLEPGFYNMDCLEGMKDFPDGFFDLAIVDPPYGISVASHKGGKIIGGGTERSEANRVYGAAKSRLASLNPITPSTTAARRTKVIFRNCSAFQNCKSSGAGTSCLTISARRRA